MRMLEVFAGSKKLARTFATGGWDTETVELKDGQDVMTFEPKGKFDYVHAAPPCQQYSGLAYDYDRIRKADKTLWRRAEDIAMEAQARFWTIENVKMAQWVHGKAADHYGPYFLWGWFPKIQARSHWSESFKGTHFDRAAGRRWNDKRTQQQREEYPQEFCDALYQTICSGFDLQPVEVPPL